MRKPIPIAMAITTILLQPVLAPGQATKLQPADMEFAKRQPAAWLKWTSVNWAVPAFA
jgi:hypothetical protein